MSGLLGILVLGAVVAFALSRTAGSRRVDANAPDDAMPPAGPPAPPAAAAPTEDHEFLLNACRGDEDDLLRRLEVEIRRNPNLSEAQAYRRAIRSWFQEKRGGTHGTPGGEGSEGEDTWL